MAKANLLGYQVMKGTSKRTGKPYDGFMLHISHEDSNVKGVAVESIYCDHSAVNVDDLFLGDSYDFNYETNFNGYSRLVSVVPCE